MDDILSLGGLFYRNAPTDYRISPHAHDQWQWYVVLHGEVVHEVDGVVHRLTNGQGLFIPPKVVRSPQSHDAAPGYLMVLFSTELNLSTVTGAPHTIPPHLYPDLEALANELKEPADGYANALIRLLVTRLVLGLYREGQKIPTREELPKTDLNSTSHRAIANQAIAYMEAHLFRQLSRDDMAAAVHCSPPHFARIFKAAIGTTPGAYLTQLRLDRAKEFLRGSTLSISQIAMEVGFNSFSHFTQLFKREVGTSPSQYRKESTQKPGRPGIFRAP